MGNVMKMLAVCCRGGVVWFRLFGYGLCVESASGHVPLFSERNGYRKALYLFGLRFEVLRP